MTLITLPVFEPDDEGSEMTPGYLARRGVAAERVATFMRAAADFYRSAPSSPTCARETVRIEGVEAFPIVASLLGRAGMETSVAIFFTEDDAQVFFEQPDDASAREIPCLLLTHEVEAEGVLREAREHGWPLARVDMAPVLVRLDRMQDGLADDLGLQIATDVLKVLEKRNLRQPGEARKAG